MRSVMFFDLFVVIGMIIGAGCTSISNQASSELDGPQLGSAKVKVSEKALPEEEGETNKGESSVSVGHASISKALVSADDAIAELIHDNNEFVNSHNEDYFRNIKTDQHPAITMICCSDSRVQTNEFSLDPVDKIFSIRVIGNQFLVGEGSVEYGVHHLHTPILLILGHTHCGAIKAAMSNYGMESTHIIRELDHLHIPISMDTHEGDEEIRWLENTERNVDYQVQLALHEYSELVREGKLTIIGAVYDFINAYGNGNGRMIITNINGEKDTDTIKRHMILNKIKDTLKTLSVARILR